MLDALLPIALTTADEGAAYLKRETTDRGQVIAALNQAAALLERMTGRRLAFTTYRDAVAAGNATATADSTSLTGIADTSVIEPGDPAFGSVLRPGTRVVSVDSATAITVAPAPTIAGTFALTVGSEPEVQQGPMSDVWTRERSDWPILAKETPVHEVFAVKALGWDGVATALDLTGMRVDKESGAIYLPSGCALGSPWFEIHYSAGLRFPTATIEGDAADALTAQLATHRIAQIVFQDYRNSPGRSSEQTLGGMSRSGGFDMPPDVEDLIAQLRRL